METIKSNKQIVNIIKDGGKKNLRSNFRQLIERFFKRQEYDLNLVDKEIQKLIKSNATDDDIYAYIYEKLGKDYDASLGERSSSKVSDIVQLIPSSNFTIKKFLDIGCKDGSNCVEARKVWKLEKDQVIGYDIIDDKALKTYVDEFTYIGPKDSKFNTGDKYYNGSNINEENVDVAIAFAVLHHVSEKDIEKLMENIAKAVRKGGFFVIREHDVKKEEQELIQVIDIEHVIYSYLGGEKTLKEYKEENPEHSGNYYSQKEWDEFIEKYGFAKVKNFTLSKRLEEVNKYATRMYYATYIKL